MACIIPYLLRTRSQLESFRQRHEALIRERGPAMREWFQGLPLYEWVPFRCRIGQEEATVGLLCHLYWEGEINLTVSRDGAYIQRGALSEEEYRQWADVRFRHARETAGRKAE